MSLEANKAVAAVLTAGITFMVAGIVGGLVVHPHRLERAAIPTGEVQAEATREKPIALVELDLEKRIVQPWLGDMKTRTWKERRGDLRVEAPR